jgi:flagellar assembly factor FliW
MSHATYNLKEYLEGFEKISKLNFATGKQYLYKRTMQANSL